jgi:hypothetical protein
VSYARTLAAFALVVAAFAALASILTSGVPAHAVQAPAPVVVQAPAVQAAPVVEEPALDEDPFLGALLGDAGLPANALDLSYAADRVCEGMTAGVPLLDMADAVAGEFSVDDEQAHEFVRLAATIRCSAP